MTAVVDKSFYTTEDVIELIGPFVETIWSAVKGRSFDISSCTWRLMVTQLQLLGIITNSRMLLCPTTSRFPRVDLS